MKAEAPLNMRWRCCQTRYRCFTITRGSRSAPRLSEAIARLEKVIAKLPTLTQAHYQLFLALLQAEAD